MKRRRLYEEGSGVEDINISPLIDVVFILLIFFMVTAVFTKETGVEIDRPQALSAKEVDKQTITFALSAEGKVFHDGREIGTRGVRPVVKRELRNGDRPVVILADKSARVEEYTRIHDEATLGGAKVISLATQP